MKNEKKPGLYGISASNRTNMDLWGKNQFNSSFPIALACDHIGFEQVERGLHIVLAFPFSPLYNTSHRTSFRKTLV